MNIGQARTSKQYENPTAEKGKRAAKAVAFSFGKFLITVILIFVIAGCIIGCALFAYIMSYSDSKLATPLENLSLDYTSTVYAYDNNAQQYVEIEKIYSEENRIWVDYNQIPENLKNAYIAIEDQRFYSHNGVDWKRTVGSFINLIVPIYDGKAGGSTITQQLIKNATGEDEYRVDRKIKEIMTALNLEKEYDKDEILLAYMNIIYLGNNAYGVQVAANTYFNKDVSELTLAECACIAGITQNPTKYNPFIHPKNNRTRMENVLFAMLKQGLINDEEYAQAKAEELHFATEIYYKDLKTVQSFFVDMVIDDVVTDLQKKTGCTEQAAKKQLYNYGYNIYVTADLEIQAILDECYMDDDTFPIFKDEPEQPQSAMVILDGSGKILGIAGARGEKTGSLSWNYATMSKRQPGSSIKPLSVYAPAVETNKITYSTMLNDQRITLSNDGWTPKNAYTGYKGNMTAAAAVARSCNTIAAQLVVNYLGGPDLSFRYATNRFGLTTLVESEKIGDKYYTDIGPAAMSLGAMTHGVTLLEMTAAYQSFQNHGVHTEPYSYTHITDSEGNTVLETIPVSTQAISEDSAYVMNKMLEAAVTYSYGTCRKMALDDGVTVCGKSGTTNNNRDKWAIGYTGYYVAGVWCGYDASQGMTIGGATNPSVTAWQIVMQKIYDKKGLGEKEIPMPNTIEKLKYCTLTGNLASPSCASTAFGWYKKSYKPPVCTCGGATVLPTPEDPTVSDPTESNPIIIIDPTASDPTDPSDPQGGTTAEPEPIPVDEPLPTEAAFHTHKRKH